MSIYELNPELDPQVYGKPANDPIGTVRAYLGPHPSEHEPAQAAYCKVDLDKWSGYFRDLKDDDWVKDCPVIYRPIKEN